jgi:hypothetical protein
VSSLAELVSTAQLLGMLDPESGSHG